MATTIRLKQSVIEAIRSNQDSRNRLMYELKVSYPTMQRYLDNNSDNLTKAGTLVLISKITGISKDKLLDTGK